MKENKAKLAFTAYAIGFLITFGHCFNNMERDPKRDIAMENAGNAAGSILASTAWPLYWSVQAFKK